MHWLQEPPGGRQAAASLTDSRSSLQLPPLLSRALGAHLSHHCCQVPQDQAPAAASAHPYEGDNNQHTLRKESTGIHTKIRPCTKYIKLTQATQGHPHI